MWVRAVIPDTAAAFRFLSRETLTDSSGAYVIAGLVDGDYHVSFSPAGQSRQNVLAGCYAANLANGFAPRCSQATTVTIHGGNVAHRDVGVPAGHRVLGRVRDPNGAPLCYMIRASSTGEPNTARLPDATGCGGFSIIGVPAGTLTLTVLPRGQSQFLPITKKVLVDNADIKGVSIWPDPGERISGRILTSHGDPVANATVALINQNFSGGFTLTDANGRYSVAAEQRRWLVSVDPTNGGLGENSGVNGRAGLYTASNSSHWTADADHATLLAAGSHTKIDMRLPPGYTISGRVRDANGAPVAANVRVGTYDAGGTYTSRVVTDANGRWLLTGLGPGHYEIDISPEDTTTTGYPEGFYSSSAPGHFTRGQSHETLVYIGP
jgi:hypothetical protein